VRARLVCVLPLAALTIGCGGSERKSAAPGATADAAPAAPASSRPPASAAPRKTVIFVGTSLTAGLGLDPDQAFPALVQAKIDSAGLPFHVVNAGNSGETAAGARRRVETWLIRQPFDVMVLETGSNDMLRGQPVDSTRAEIQAIIDTVRAAHPGVRVVLTGMMALPNLGRRYGEQFRGMYPELARKNHLVLVPFLLDSVGGRPELNQPDGLHPDEEGERIVARNVWRVLQPVLAQESAPAPGAAPR
jgi:acyl-CoA thioesterase-1